MNSVWILMDEWDDYSSIVTLHSTEVRARLARLREIQYRRKEQPNTPIRVWVYSLRVVEMPVN